MTSHIETFFLAWGETDTDTRATTLRSALSDTIQYMDPRTPEPITDLQALIEYVAMYSEYAPGATAAVVNVSQTGHNIRATVKFAMPDGNAQFGQYFVEPDAQGKLARMVGFVGLGSPE